MESVRSAPAALAGVEARSDRIVRFTDANVWLQRRGLVLQVHGEAFFFHSRDPIGIDVGAVHNVCFNRLPYFEWRGRQRVVAVCATA